MNIYLKKRTSETAICLDKVWYNLKKRWYLCVISFCVALAVAIIMTMSKYDSSNRKIIAASDEIKYKAVTMIYMEPMQMEALEGYKDSIQGSQEETMYAIAESYQDEVRNALNRWNWEKSYQLIYDCEALLSSSKIRNGLNQKLKENNMKVFKSDKEAITIEIFENSRCYNLIVKGEESDRVEFIADMVTSLLLDEAKKILEIENARVIDKAEAFLYREGEEIENSKKIVSEEELKLNIESFISPINVFILVIGIVTGILFVTINTILDKKIYSKREMEEYFTVPFVGELIGRKKDKISLQTDVVAQIIIEKCTKQKIKEILFTTVGLQKDNLNIEKVFTSFVNNKSENVQTMQEKNLLYNSKAINCAAHAEGIILFVQCNEDSIPDIERALEQICAVDGQLLGYVLVD